MHLVNKMEEICEVPEFFFVSMNRRTPLEVFVNFTFSDNVCENIKKQAVLFGDLNEITIFAPSLKERQIWWL